MNVTKSPLTKLTRLNGRQWCIPSALWAMTVNELAHGPIHAFSDFGDDPLPQTETAGGVGIIGLNGLLQRRVDGLMHLTGGTAVEFVGKVFATMLRNPRVKAIVLKADSPGGDFQGVPELAKRIYEARGKKPIVGFVDGVAAGSAYWILAAAEKVIATSSAAGVGGLGFQIVHFDHSKAMEKAGIKTTFIASSNFKGEFNPYEPLTDEARAHALSQVATWDGWLISDVAKYRGVSATRVAKDFGRGRVLMPDDAKSVGLIDAVEDFDSVIRRLGGTLD